MKRIFSYLNIAVLLVALSAMFASCTDNDANDDGNLGLSIKVFAPTVVVPGTSMTINGSGFGDVTEIVFPGDIVVGKGQFEIVTNEMIRVKAPLNLTKGGVIAVRNAAGETAVSRLPLAVGKTEIVGFAPDPDEPELVIKGNETVTVYGKCMQFVTAAEFIDENDEVVRIPASEFMRVANGRVVIQVPAKIKTGRGTYKIFLSDGTVVESPEYEFLTATSSGGHWVDTRRFIWENETGEAIPAWGGKFRFCEVGHDFNNECIAQISSEDWSLMKDDTFYALIKPNEGANVRVTTGWWKADYGGTDYNCIQMAEDDVVAGNKVIALTPSLFADYYEKIDEQHILFTGDAYTLLGIFVVEREWVDGDAGHFEKQRKSFWKNETGEAIPSWGGKFRFCEAGHDSQNECIAEFDTETWNVLKSQPFRIAIEPTADNPNIRVTTGWWKADYGGTDYNCFNDVEVDEDGTMFIELYIPMYDDFLSKMDEQHLLFTGDGYKLLEIYQEEDFWVEGGDGADGPEQVVIWENQTGEAIPAWGSKFRFCEEGHDYQNECIAEISSDVWSIMKDETFYALIEPADGANVRVTTGWWKADYGGTDYNCIQMAEDDLVSGLKVIAVTPKNYEDFYGKIDEQHILFTGDAYTLKKLYYYRKK